MVGTGKHLLALTSFYFFGKNWERKGTSICALTVAV